MKLPKLLFFFLFTLAATSAYAVNPEKRLTDLVPQLISRGDARAYFAAVYRLTTEESRKRVEAGEFANTQCME